MGLTLKQKASERMARMKALGIATARENAGMAQDIVDLVFDNYAAGADWADCIEAAKEELARRALERYGDKIRAALRRAGLDYPDDQELTPDGIKEVVARQSGLDLDELTGDGVKRAIDGLLSARLSAALGVDVPTVLDTSAMKLAVEAAVKASIANGTAERLLTAGLTRAARKLVTFKRAGINAKADQKRTMQRWYQKRYARTHSQIWVPR